MTYRLSHLFWGTGYLSLGFAAFDAVGAIAAVCVMVASTAIAQLNSIPRLSILVASVLGILLMTGQLLSGSCFPCNRSLHSIRNLVQVTIFYDMQHKKLPNHPSDDPAEPPTAWPVRLLTEIEQPAMAEEYDYTQPWDHPNNAKLLAPRLFVDANHRGSQERIFCAIVGPETTWGDGSQGRSLSEVQDDPGETILFVEVDGHGIHWCEPRDLTVDEAVELLTSPVTPETGGQMCDAGYFWRSVNVRSIAMCNGRVYLQSEPLEQKTVLALITANGGEQVSLPEYDLVAKPPLDYRRAISYPLFILFSLTLLTRASFWAITEPEASAPGESTSE